MACDAQRGHQLFVRLTPFLLAVLAMELVVVSLRKDACFNDVLLQGSHATASIALTKPSTAPQGKAPGVHAATLSTPLKLKILLGK
jgi:hypothetical protein